MGFFQYISQRIGLSSVRKKAQVLCQNLLHAQELDLSDLDALVLLGDEAVEIFRLYLHQGNFPVGRCEQLIDLLGAMPLTDKNAGTASAMLDCFIEDPDHMLLLKTLKYLAHRDAVDSLLDALHSKDSHVRSCAAKALAGCVDSKESSSLVEALIEALGDEDARVRSDIVFALGNFSGVRVKQTLLDSLADDNWLVCDSASTALALFHDEDILDHLSLLMETSADKVRVQVLRTIGRMKSRVVAGKRCSLDKHNIIVSALNDGQIEVQSAAIDALATHANRSSIEPLMLYYHQAGESLRKRIYLACEKIGMQRVISFLSADNYQVRMAVAEMLANYGDSDYLPLLNDAWQFEDHADVQMWIVIAIGKMAAQQGNDASDTSIKVLIQTAEGSDTAMAYHAKKALEKISHPLAEQFVRAPLQRTKFSIACPNCLEILELELPLIGKKWNCDYCYLGFKLRPGAYGIMIISAITSKQQVISPSSQIQTWFEVLSIHPNADVDTVKSTFRRLLKQYHPDKVAMLGPEFKQLAEEKTRLLTWALRAGLKKG